MRILCLDFDGVLHSYKSGWQGPRNIPDPPVDGAIKWLNSLFVEIDQSFIDYWEIEYKSDFDVQIYSSRSQYWGGRKAMKRWLLKWGLSPYIIKLIRFPKKKPAAFLTIDDRAICFDGNFPSTETILNFKPWYK